MITDIVLTYIGLFRNFTDKKRIRLFFESDPYNPSLLSVLKTLRFAGMNASAGKCGWEKLKDLSSPFLLHLNINGEEKIIIAQNDSDNIGLLIYNPKKNKWEYIDKGEILKVWSNVVIFTNDKILNRSFQIVKFITIVICLGLITASMFYNTTISPILLGIFISCYICLKEKMPDISFVNKVCHISSITDCDKVDESQYSKILGFKQKDLATSYFLSQLLIVFIGTILKITEVAITLFAVSFVLSLPCLIYSTYGQIKVGRICPLCISILVILLWESWLYFPYVGYESIDFNILFLWSVFFTIALGLLNTRSLIISENETLKKYYSQLLRIKRTKEIIISKSHEIESISCSIWLGNEQSTKVITTIVSPECIHCRKVMEDVIDLIESGCDFRWNIVFGKSSKHDSMIIKKLIGCYLKNKSVFLKELRYYLRKRDCNYVVNENESYKREVEDIVLEFRGIIKSLNIIDFPQIILNNRLLTSFYKSSDLKYLICD